MDLFTRPLVGATQRATHQAAQEPLSPCKGFLFTLKPGGVWSFRVAHRGRRSCDDGECRMRYWRHVYRLAIAGLEELAVKGSERPKFLTVTLPADHIKVPVQWFLDEQRRDVAKHVKKWQKNSCPIPSACPLRITYEGREYQVEAGHVLLPPIGRMAYRYLAACWNRFTTGVRRTLKKSHGSLGVFWYMRVVEEQRRGAPHYHALVYTPYITQADLSRLAVAAKLGFVVDIRAASSEEHAAYATKVASYAAKTIKTGLATPRGMRFYTRSQIWAKDARSAWASEREEWKLRQEAAGVQWRYVTGSDFSHAVDAAAKATGVVVAEATGEVYARAKQQAA